MPDTDRRTSNLIEPGPTSFTDEEGLAEVISVTSRIRRAMQSVIEGKQDQIDATLMVLLAGGHLMVEDVPGVGKTVLAKALGRVLDCTVHRIQFTPDLLPSDITGISVFNQDTRDFEFKPGGIFANIVLGDEINRASPKTQSALLEAMEEGQVSVDGLTHHLSSPFMVIATQNPVEMEGTYPLPEAQRDRFMARIQMGYPSPAAEVAMLEAHGGVDPLTRLRPVADAATVLRMIQAVTTVHVAPSVKEYIVAVVGATRASEDLRLGGSPRASLHLLKAARARAAMAGRDYVIPDDVLALVETVLAHRVLPTTQVRLSGQAIGQIVYRAAANVRIPSRR